MCARFYRYKDLQELIVRFKLIVFQAAIEAQYNIAPTDKALVIPATTGDRKAELMTFGMKNPWKPEAGPLFNSRGESVMGKPFYKRFLQHQRCLIPADGFFEWKQLEKGSLPYRFNLKGEETFGFAGIFENGCFSIITTEPNSIVSPVHKRMPVILRREEEDMWLDAHVSEPYKLAALLAPFPAEQLVAVEVSKAVNASKNKTADVIKPLR